MKRTVRNLRAAGEDLAAAIRWYESRQAGLGARLLDSFQRTLDEVSTYPECGVPHADGRSRRIPLRDFPYLLVYTLTQDAIIVIAVAHTRRRPDYWASRI